MSEKLKTHKFGNDGMRLIALNTTEQHWLWDLLKNAEWEDYPEDVKGFYKGLMEEMNDL